MKNSRDDGNRILENNLRRYYRQNDDACAEMPQGLIEKLVTLFDLSALPALSTTTAQVEAVRAEDASPRPTAPINLFKRTWSSQAAFTLVELLVVISIIAVLAAMLLPALNKAMVTARSVTCANNMRQLGLGFFNYADQTNDSTPPVSYSAGSKSPIWADEICRVGLGLQGYSSGYNIASAEVVTAKMAGIWNCPENPEQRVRCGWGSSVWESEILNSSYTINGWNPAESGYEGRAAMARLSKIRNASQLYLLLEGHYFRMEAWYDTGADVYPAAYQGTGVPRARYTHQARMNILYVDGHVSASAYPVRPRGSVSGPEYYKWYAK